MIAQIMYLKKKCEKHEVIIDDWIDIKQNLEIVTPQSKGHVLFCIERFLNVIFRWFSLVNKNIIFIFMCSFLQYD